MMNYAVYQVHDTSADASICEVFYTLANTVSTFYFEIDPHIIHTHLHVYEFEFIESLISVNDQESLMKLENYFC